MTVPPQPISWIDAEPRRVADELALVPLVAPDLEWTGRSWVGLLPAWPFTRVQPPQLDSFLGGSRFSVRVEYLESFPMTAPRFYPVDPVPPVWTRSMHAWHVNPDGSLCLLQSTDAWDPASSAADLVSKAAGWFLEYHLLDRDLVPSMTVAGIVNDDRLDHLFRP